MRKALAAAVLAATLLLVPGSAEARSCGTYDTGTDGTRMTVDAYDAASCTFADAAADRFWAVDGIPRRLWIWGTRLTFVKHRSGAGWDYWFYDGMRHGRYAAVFFTEEAAGATSYGPAPSVPYPGRGYPVVCADGWISHSGGIQGACSHHGGVG
jgi:hypothetical protein